jgi:long-chain acyl-CoA synthetase
VVIAVVDRPWLARYRTGHPSSIPIEHETALDMFRASADRAPDAPLVHYLDRTLTVAEVDRMSDALAVGLAAEGVAAGDRVAVYLQNVPQFVIGMLAIWKAGAVMVSINAMYRDHELRTLLDDSGAVAVICLESLYGDVVAQVVGAGVTVVTTSELDLLDAPDPRLFASVSRARHDGTLDLLELVARHDGEVPPDPGLTAGSVAFLTYTSGTTGPAKGAMNTHRNVVFNAQVYRDWTELTPADVILGVAPLFHITGLIGHVAVSLLTPAPLVLGYRFHAAVYLELIQRYRVTFTIGSITVFNALMNDPALGSGSALATLTKVWSGGQAVAPTIVADFERAAGAYINIAYGLTETTSPTHLTPMGARSPVDPGSGALSIGVPVFDTQAAILDDDGAELPPGETGEICVMGPQVVPGYWNKPGETAAAFRDGWFHTGDVGVMDADGWFYVVDRKKDMINVSGNKVWPREIEDVLYEHPAVREAAVVGVPDAYRGETVAAFVSLKAGHTVTADELAQFCRARIAAYKCPRTFEFLDELPKTVTGKILRREMRDMRPS